MCKVIRFTPQNFQSKTKIQKKIPNTLTEHTSELEKTKSLSTCPGVTPFSLKRPKPFPKTGSQDALALRSHRQNYLNVQFLRLLCRTILTIRRTRLTPRPTDSYHGAYTPTQLACICHLPIIFVLELPLISQRARNCQLSVHYVRRVQYFKMNTLYSSWEFRTMSKDNFVRGTIYISISVTLKLMI